MRQNQGVDFQANAGQIFTIFSQMYIYYIIIIYYYYYLLFIIFIIIIIIIYYS